MAGIKKSEHKSYGMGLHDEVLTGRTQQTFFNSEEVAIRSLLPHEIDTYDPFEGEVKVWQA